MPAAGETKDAEKIEVPVAGEYKAGWGFGTEFTNLCRGMGGELLGPGSAELALRQDRREDA